MPLRQFTVDFLELSKERSLRNDADFIGFQKKSLLEESYSFSDLFRFSNDDNVDLTYLDDDFLYSEIGNVSKDGEVEPVKLNFGERSKETENYYKKIENGDIIQTEKGDILLAKVRPNLKKYVYIDQNNKDLFFTSAFIHLVPKRLNKILYYSMRTIFYDNLIAISRQGKGYPTLKEDDFQYLRFSRHVIDGLEKQKDELIKEIEGIEEKIGELRSEITQPGEIINQVFAKEFGFNMEEVKRVEQIKYFFTDSDITKRNSNLRSSVRWNKIKPIQKVLYDNNKYINKLGKYIISTKNGWSPNCKESDTENYVFGVNAISQDGYVKYEDIKFTNESKKNIANYYAKENDLFVSRGNTVDLVALASVVKNLPEEQNYIFPDLFIKIELNTQLLNKEYLAFLFNSIIGRYYFKYSAKGKNQTMVKISFEELDNFYLPVPSISRQQALVEEIKAKMDAQESIRQKIQEKRNEIEHIILNAII